MTNPPLGLIMKKNIFTIILTLAVFLAISKIVFDIGVEESMSVGYDKGYTEGYAKGNDEGIHWAGCVSLMHRDKDKNGKLSKNTVDYCKKYGVYDESYKSIMGK